MVGITANHISVLCHDNFIAVDLRKDVMFEDIFGMAIRKEAGVE